MNRATRCPGFSAWTDRISIEHQHLAKKYVLRGVESGGAAAEVGAYASCVDEQGNALPWLQRVDRSDINRASASGKEVLASCSRIRGRGRRGGRVRELRR